MALTRAEKASLAAIEAGATLKDKLKGVAKALHGHLSGYDWVGFYVADGEEPWLVLGPYVGAPTDHTRIPFGRGICGQVAVSKETFVVPDVSAQDNYLACSLDVRSEIVVPILVEGRFVAQIDIDSHQLHRFTDDDRAMLERIAERLSLLFA